MNEIKVEHLPKQIHEELFANPFIGICITDADGRCIAVNDAQTRITDIPKHEFLNKKMEDLVKKKLLSTSSTVEVLKHHQSVMMHQVACNSRSYEVKGVPIFDESGKIQYVISYLLDISELMHIKELLSKLQADKEFIENEIKELKKVAYNSSNIVYCCEKMQRVVELTKKVAPMDVSVLITGESGTGKELIADLLHKESPRKDKPFIKINCAAIPEQLLESEMFGYEAGAFTGGNPKGKSGLFESANGGVLLLDEIGEMPLTLQAKLLRVLQDQRLMRIGGRNSIQVDVRLIASTNASLEQLISEKKFREDLYYRFNIIEIRMPNLKERWEDIPVLIEHFMALFNSKYHTDKIISPETIRYMASREYPGNVRQLKNMVERLIIQSPQLEISFHDAFEVFNHTKIETNFTDISIDMDKMKNASLKEITAEYESKILMEYFKVYKNINVVAQKLKTDRTTIARKLSKYGLKIRKDSHELTKG